MDGQIESNNRSGWTVVNEKIGSPILLPCRAVVALQQSQISMTWNRFLTTKKQHRNIGANGKWRVTPKYQIWHHEVPFPFARFKNKLNLEHIWTRPLTGQVKPTRLYFTGTMLALSFFFSRKIYVLPGQDNHVWPFEYYASVWIKRQSALELILRALCLFFGTLLSSSYPKQHGNTSAVIAGVFCYCVPCWQCGSSYYPLAHPLHSSWHTFSLP